MSEDETRKVKADVFKEALRQLAQAEGIWRPDLLEVLNGPASNLRKTWGIEKLETADDTERARSTTHAFLLGYLQQVSTPKARSVDGQNKRAVVFELVYKASFNLAPKGATLTTWNIEKRRDWLMEKHGISRALIDRDYKHALGEVARLIQSGYQVKTLDAEPGAVESAAELSPVIEPASSDVRPAWYRRRPLQLAGLAGAVLLTTAIVVPFSLSEETNGASPPATSASNTLPSTMKGAASPALTGPPPPPLIVEVQSIRDAASGWHVTFDRAATAGTTDPEVLASSPRASFPNGKFDEFLRSELAVGGYLAGGATIKLQVSGVATGTVEVTDVRPVIEKREPIKDGLTVVMGTQGNELDENMGLQLDEANPVAKDYDPTQIKFGKPYFLDKHIRIAPNTSDTINIMTLATRYSYTFLIAIDYTADGKRGTRTVSLDGSAPFRVTPDFCGTQAFNIPSADRDRLRAVRYATVHAMGVDPAIANYAWKEVDPAGYSANCGG